jgi:SAM-dependent methyltransferase
MLTRLSRFISRISKSAASAPASANADDPVAQMIPGHSIAAYVGGTAEQFRFVGEFNVRRMRELAGLSPGDRVLEVGCGIGRIAIALTQFLESGSYVGFDIVPHGIEWCRNKITPRYPNFRFFVADIQNGLYNPKGKVAARDYRFPFDDRSFDFVFLTSVFTHMPYDEVQHYAAEISRVLDAGGRCFCTAFVIGDEARSHLEAGTSARVFRDSGQGHWIEAQDDPMKAVGYEEPVLEQVFRGAGLEVTQVARDSWWSNPWAQDAIVLRKAD